MSYFGLGGKAAMKFGEKLKELREAADLSQQQLGETAGVTLHTVRNYEQGQRQPSWAAVVKLSRALGVSTEEFASCDLEEETGERKKKRRPARRRESKG